MHIGVHVVYPHVGSTKAAHYMQNNLEQTGRPAVSIVLTSLARPPENREEILCISVYNSLNARRLIRLAGGSQVQSRSRVLLAHTRNWSSGWLIDWLIVLLTKWMMKWLMVWITVEIQVSSTENLKKLRWKKKNLSTSHTTPKTQID